MENLNNHAAAAAPKGAISTLSAMWTRELRGKFRVWGSWCLVPLYLAIVNRYPSVAGLITLAAGTLLRAWASGLLRKESTLATDGPYALSRNPLYLGSLLVAISMPLGQDNYWLTAVVAVLFIALFRMIISKEQTVLVEKFGATYRAYQQAVPMFFGLRSLLNLPRAFRTNNFSAGVWKTNRGWEPFYVAIAIVGITSAFVYFRG